MLDIPPPSCLQSGCWQCQQQITVSDIEKREEGEGAIKVKISVMQM